MGILMVCHMDNSLVVIALVVIRPQPCREMQVGLSCNSIGVARPPKSDHAIENSWEASE